MTIESSHYDYDPFGNFLFTKQEFDSAENGTYLPLKCLCCGETFKWSKERLDDLVNNFTANRTAVTACSKACITKPIEYECAYCGKHFSKPLKTTRKTKTGEKFCSQNCKAQYYKEHNITRKKTEYDITVNPNGNFLFTKEEYEEARRPSNVKTPMLKLRCLGCGKEFLSTYETIAGVLSGNEKVGKYCSYKCKINDGTNLETVLAKRRQTCQDKYGVDNVMQDDEIRNRLKATYIEKYGVDNPNKSDEVKAKTERTHRTKYWDTFTRLLKEKHISYNGTKEDYVNTRDNFKYRCNDCGRTWESTVSAVQHVYCEYCFRTKKSKPEYEILTLIRNNYDGEIVTNSRSILPSGLELDIYLPERKLAIEFDGTYWHSDVRKPNEYHKNKTEECEELGIRLIHIFQWEWSLKRHMMEALLKSALGIFEKTIYARKCVVSKINSTDYENFCNLYHLNGSVKAKDRFGLFYEGELVSVIGFGKSRFKDSEYELYRYCVKSDYRIIGGFSKLIKNCGIDHFVSYVDRSHFDGRGYIAIGFTRVGETPPNYCYVSHDGTAVVSRMQAQKHKLASLLEKFDDTMTESENMAMSGYLRIFDSGNLKMEYNSEN